MWQNFAYLVFNSDDFPFQMLYSVALLSLQVKHMALLCIVCVLGTFPFCPSFVHVFMLLMTFDTAGLIIVSINWIETILTG